MVREGNVGLGSRRFPSRAATLVLIASAVVNGGCDVPRLPGVYRIDIQQGNIVDREMVDRLEIGMERRKVRFILGTPLLVDPFNPDRWIYFYSLRAGSEAAASHRLTLYFVDDRLARIDDRLDPDVVPETEERVQKLVKVPNRKPRESFLGSLVPDFLKQSDELQGEEAAGSARPSQDEETGDATTDPSGVESTE